MNVTARIAITHAVGVTVLLACAVSGYRFAYRPAMDARSQSNGLGLRVQQQEEELRDIAREDGDVSAVTLGTPEPEPLKRAAIANLRPMTPTVFLSTFEGLAREIGLRVESSAELAAPGSETEGEGSLPSGLLVEVTGTGSFDQVVLLCESLESLLPGVEIRRLQITRRVGDSVRWVMVCRNHEGPKG